MGRTQAGAKLLRHASLHLNDSTVLPCYGTFQNTHSPKLAPAEVCFSVARDRTARFHVNCAFEYCVFATKILSSPQAPTRRNRRKKVATRSRHYYCD